MSTIKYGIDLGTTNSAITRFENGKAVVKKNSMQSDTTPSCVAFTRSGKVLVGARAHSQLEKDYSLSFRRPDYQSSTYIEFKRLMGTDHQYVCPSLGHNLTPEDLSAEVLRELRKSILDDDVRTAVITVPAMFTNTQKDATKRAAQQAGFDYIELIQEPVAASVAYGLGSKMKDAYWLVFDFGGGTFDAALMKIESGVMQAIDTAGNNKLGGKDIDQAIIDELIIPQLEQDYTLDDTLATRRRQFSAMWKAKAEEAKIALSFNDCVDIETDLGDDYGNDDLGMPLSLSISITAEELERISAPIYQKAIDITTALLERNNINRERLGALILVGGPTHSPILRSMLREQVTTHIDTSIDPMTCVAAGAAIYGSTVEVPENIADTTRDHSKVQLLVSAQATSVATEEWASVALLPEKSDNLTEDAVRIEFARQDGMFVSPQTIIDSVGDVICLPLVAGRTNVFEIHCFDSRGNALECEPSQLTIIQGIAGLGDAVLPMALGLGVLNDDDVEVFTPIKGLEKSRKLPSTGIIQGLRTPKDIRPGVDSDELRLSLYQIEESTDGTRVLYCQRIYDVHFNGDDVPQLLPTGTLVDLKLHAERSGTIDSFVVEIPTFGLTVDLTERITTSTTAAPSLDYLAHEMADAAMRVNQLCDDKLNTRLSMLRQRLASARDDRDTIDSTFHDLQSLCRDIDRELAKGDWDREEEKLRNMMQELATDNAKYGNSGTNELVQSLHGEMERVIKSRDIKLARNLTRQMRQLDYNIAEVDYHASWIVNWNRNFGMYLWRNTIRARELINQGMALLAGSPSAHQLAAITHELHSLLPESERPDVLRR